MLYLKLFHGRKIPAESMDDWGSDGPIFGPYQYAHTTYGHHVKMGHDGDDGDELFVTPEDLIYYDGVYYGDWSVFPENLLEKHDQSLCQAYDPLKARIPEPLIDENQINNPFSVKIIVYIRGGVCFHVKTNLPDNNWEYAVVDYDDNPDLPEEYIPFTKDGMSPLPYPLPPMTTMQNLIESAQKVLDTWETGDLAGSVRHMASVLKKIDG